MLKQNLLKSAVLTAAVLCVFLLASCGGKVPGGNPEQSSSQTSATTEKVQSTTDPTESETETEPSETFSETTSETTSETVNNAIAKINGGADEVGIYSIVIRLTNQAADKGTIEMVYYGAKGSPQENSVVNTFRIEYSKEAAGTFEIYTFFNGEVYQHQKNKEEMKVTNTFDKTLRAGSVIISYTPDGGDTQEIFRADAEYFNTSAN